MYNPQEELQAILDLLGEWRNKNGIGYVTMHIGEDDFGSAYDWNGVTLYEARGYYGAQKKDPSGGNRKRPMDK